MCNISEPAESYKRSMKFFLTLFLCFSSMLKVCAQTAPDFSCTDVNGEEHHLYESLDEGKIIVLDFFYVDCPPCVETSAELQSIHEDYQGTNVEVWSVSPFDYNSQIDSFQNLYNLTYLMAGTEGSGQEITELYSDSLDLHYFPTISVIAPNKEIFWDIWPYTPGGAPEWRAVIESIGVEFLSVSSADLIPVEFSVYPNPATDILQIETRTPAVSIEIYNASGQLIQVEKVSSSYLSLDIHNYPSGTYLLRAVHPEGKSSYRRFIRH